MSPERIGSLKQHSAHAAHVEDVRPGAPGTHVTSGGGVCPTSGLRLPQQPDEALLAPSLAPAVPHDPEVSAVLAAVTHELDAVIQLDVAVIVTT